MSEYLLLKEELTGMVREVAYNSCELETFGGSLWGVDDED